MAPSAGNASHPLSEQPIVRDAIERPKRQDLFQLIRRIESADRSTARLGSGTRASREQIRLGQPADMAFAPTTVDNVWLDDEGRLHIHQRVFGLLGPNGPMPLHLTEYVRDRTRNHHDRTLQAFLDLFHHRMTSLFYRAWATCQATVSRDRPDEDRFSAFAAALVGMADESFMGRDSLDDDGRRFHAGRLTCRDTNAAGLEMILGDVLGVPARVEEFAGSWVELPESTWCRVGRDPESSALGSAVLGRRIHDPQQAFRVKLGPLTHAELLEFLPIGGEFVKLRDWVRTYAGRAYAWDVQMIVLADEVPPTRLGDASWLGWTTWIRSGKAEQDDDRLVFNGEA